MEAQLPMTSPRVLRPRRRCPSLTGLSKAVGISRDGRTLPGVCLVTLGFRPCYTLSCTVPFLCVATCLRSSFAPSLSRAQSARRVYSEKVSLPASSHIELPAKFQLRHPSQRRKGLPTNRTLKPELHPPLQARAMKDMFARSHHVSSPT